MDLAPTNTPNPLLEDYRETLYRSLPTPQRFLTEVGASCAGTLGLAPESLSYESFSLDERTVEDDREWVSARIDDALNNLATFELLYRVRVGDSERLVFDKGQVLGAPDGSGVEIVGSLTDISGLVAMLAPRFEIDKLEAIARVTNRIAHDFNNFLCVVIPSLEMAIRDCEENRAAAEWIQKTMESSERWSRYNNQLLALGRRQMMMPGIVNSTRAIRNLEPELSRLVGEQVVLSVSLAEPPLPIRCAADELRECLLGLCANAVEAMPQGGTLELSTLKVNAPDRASRLLDNSSGEFVLFRIADSGEGMSPNVRSSCLEPFFTTRQSAGHPGLGLSTAYGFARRCGGHLEISSEPGRGTEVQLYLPRLVE